MNNDPNDLTKLSAQRTDEIEEAPDPDGPANPTLTTNSVENKDSSIPPRTYQDDFDSKDDDVDPIANEATEDPAELLQIPSSEFKKELDGVAIDESAEGMEDMRETIEDRDEDDGSPASVSQV
jgi:hypothetical protein